MTMHTGQGHAVNEDLDSVLSASKRRGSSLQVAELHTAGSGEVSPAPRSPEKVVEALPVSTGPSTGQAPLKLALSLAEGKHPASNEGCI